MRAGEAYVDLRFSRRADKVECDVMRTGGQLEVMV